MKNKPTSPVATEATDIPGDVLQRPDDAHPGTALAPLGAAAYPPGAVMLEPEGGWPPDEFTGKGGSYVRDPLTGVRSPAQPVAADELPADLT